MRILVHSPTILSDCFCLLHCNMSIYRDLEYIRLPSQASLAFQANCGSINGAGVCVEEGTGQLSSLVVNTR